jgi:phosphoribosylformylglycinamidine synthase
LILDRDQQPAIDVSLETIQQVWSKAIERRL